MSRRGATTALASAACGALLLCGATGPLIPVGSLLALLFTATVLAPKGVRVPAPVLALLHSLLVVAFLYLALLREPQLEFLRLLLTFAAPLLVVRGLMRDSEFNAFLIFLVSLLLVVGSVAVAPGLRPLLITGGYALVACQALVVLTARPAPRDAGVRLRLLGRPGWWAAAPALAAHHLALGGLILGGLLYLVVPRPPADAAEGGQDSLLAQGGESRTGTTAAGRTGFPRDVRIGDIGRIKRLPYLAVRVDLRAEGRAYDPPEERRSMLLLRARAWHEYDPRTRAWRRPQTVPQQIGPSGVLGPGDAPLDWDLEILGYDGRTLFLPQRARRIRGAGGPFFIDRMDVVTAAEAVAKYAVESDWPVPAAELARLRPDASDRRLLEVPASLARALDPHVPPAPAGDLAAAAEAIRAAFAQGFRYTLDLPPSLPQDRDPIVAFCERREGHCELYASAACLFLRLRGVPARLAGGVRVAERLGPGRYAARLSNAHAWVEVPCHGVGYVAIDFTPPDERAEAATPGPETAEDAEATPAEAGGGGGVDWSRPFEYGAEEQEQVLDWMGERLSSGVAAGIFTALSILLVLWGILAAAARARRSPLRPRPPAGVPVRTFSFYAQFLRACAARGHVRRSAQTPREFLGSLPPDLRAEGQALTAKFEALRYGRA